MFWRANRDFSDAKKIRERRKPKDICSGATKAIKWIFKIEGRQVLSIGLFSSHLRIGSSELHTFSNCFLSWCGVKLISCKAFSYNIHIFYVHHTPPSLTSNFVTFGLPPVIATSTLVSAYIARTSACPSKKGENAGKVILEPQDQATQKFILKGSQAQKILYLSRHGLQEQNNRLDDTSEQQGIAREASCTSN